MPNAALPMLIRSATSLFPRLIPPRHLATPCLVAALMAALSGAARADESQTLTLPQARAMAIRALEIGQPALTLQLADGLKQANPTDPFTYYLIAHARAQQRQPTRARRAAARAYRFSRADRDRFEAAQLAARLAMAESRPTLTQIWLRRSAIYAPDDAAERVVARDYRRVRASNPWALNLRTELRPSSNVNNGSDAALQIIDGVPVIGILSGSARALSGVIMSTDVATTYRLRADATSATSIGGRLYFQRVALSNAAHALAPGARNSDFATTYGEMSLRHGFAAGPAGKGGTARVDLAAGGAWSGGNSNYEFARLSGERRWRLAKGRLLSLNALAEGRFDARYPTDDARIFGIGAKLLQTLPNQDRLTFSAAWRDSNARHFNGTFSAASLRTSYAFANPVGPVRLSAGLTLGYADYPVFQSGLFMVPGGRQDRSVYGDLNILFDRIDYAGFAPVLRLRVGRKSSNDSRYDTRELSVSLGIESKF